ncbi:MAG: chemotaxis protein [Desulfovibrio sp.]
MGLHSNILLESGTNELEIVEFHIDEQTEKGERYQGYYGINVAKVLEIIRKPEITRMPEVTHPSVLGAFNLRSRIIPLIDLSHWLGKNTVETGQEKVIVTEFNNTTTAFLVSGVTRIHRISWSEVVSPDEGLGHISGDCISSMVRINDRIIFILDLEGILTEINPALGLENKMEVRVPEGENYTAYIAEDSHTIREMIKSQLQEAGFTIKSFTNGQLCHDAIMDMKIRAQNEGKSIAEDIHVVVTDIEMPMMDGHTLCRKIKEDKELNNLPVILFSSIITDNLRHKGDTVGADYQISKPQINELAKRSLELIQK